jgi:hypothetical protein
VLDAHAKEICNLFWDEDKKVILTASNDKTVKMYQLPIQWPSEIIRKYKGKNEKTLLMTSSSKSVAKEEDGVSRSTIYPEEEEKSYIPVEEYKEREYDTQIKNNTEIENNHLVNENDHNESNPFEKAEVDDTTSISSSKKLKEQVVLREKYCEDLDGWDYD